MRSLAIAIALACGAQGAAPTEANMRQAWDQAWLDLIPGPATATCLLDFTTDGVDLYGVQGWSLGICIDKTLVKVDAVAGGADTVVCKAGAAPDFNKMNILADGITMGVVIDFFGETRILAPRTGFEALEVTFSDVAVAGRQTTEATSCATLGSPPVIPVVVVDGASIPFGAASGGLHLNVGRFEVHRTLELVADDMCSASVLLTTGMYAVDAVSFGVSVRPARNISYVERGAATADADFFSMQMVPGGITFGMVMSLEEPFRPLPPSNDPIEIARIVLVMVGSTELEITDDLGSPPVDIVIDSGGTSIPKGSIGIGAPITIDCGGGWGFVRGDANQDARIDISDAVYIARYIFGLVPDLDCDDSMDTNDDEVLDPGDPIYLLRYLFLGGPALAEPAAANPRAITSSDCGWDDTGGGNLDCWSYVPCW
ncbi:MAG: hypothetical protein JXP34_00735 [Planctomycetes bacterium]|nr:hypothetical protein [Planctomycetota bacterium]